MSFFHSLLTTAGSLTLYPSSDRAVMAGVGPAPQLGYLTFGIQAISPIDDSLYFIYRHGSNHNSEPDASVKAIRSTDHWDSTPTPVTIIAAPGGGVNLTSVDIFVTSTGRVLMFYSKQPVGVSTGYFKYSDTPDLSVISTEIRFSMDYDGQYIDMTGQCIEVDGIIYKTVWATDNIGGTEVPIYKSTDNGLTWTKITLISDEVEDYDETGLALHPNGTFYAFQRSNALEKLIVKTSEDLGVTWSAALITDIPARGRNGACITPQGTFCIITRHPSDGRTLLVQSNDGTDYTWDYIDGRDGIYMYGGPVWVPSYSAIIAMWSDEAENGDAFAGPTIIIAKTIIQSPTPVAAPTTYDVDYQGWLDFGSANGETLPSNATKAIDNICVAGLRTDGSLANIENFWMFEYNNAALSSIVKRSVIKPWLKVVAVASPTYSTDGWHFNGTSQYLNTQIYLSQTTIYTLNDASAFYYCATNSDTSLHWDLGTGDASFSTFGDGLVMIPKTPDPGGVAAFAVNDNTPDATTVSVASSIGFHHAVRINASTKRWYTNGVKIGADITRASVGRSGEQLLLGAVNYAGGDPHRFSARTIGLFGYGNQMSGQQLLLSNRFATRRAALGL